MVNLHLERRSSKYNLIFNRKEHMTKIVSFVAQKGGSGKTTMTAIMANYLAYKEKKKVVLIDGDAPQYNFVKQRAMELEDLTILPESVLRAHEESGVPLYSIYKAVANEDQESTEEQTYSVTRLIDALVEQGDIDYIFVDLAGTLNSPHFIEVVKRINYIFVPFMESEILFSTNYEALYVISMIAAKTQNNIKGIFEFWTRYRLNMSKEKHQKQCEKVSEWNEALKVKLKEKNRDIKVELMTSKIAEAQIVQSYEIWNTVAPPPKSALSVVPGGFKLGNYINEFLRLINE